MSSEGYPARTLHLLDTELFSKPVHFMDQDERARLSYEKAKAIGLSYGMAYLRLDRRYLTVTVVRHDHPRHCVSNPEVLGNAQRARGRAGWRRYDAARHTVQPLRGDDCTIQSTPTRACPSGRRSVTIPKTVRAQNYLVEA